MDGDTKWKKFRHPSIYGKAVDLFKDQFFYDMLMSEFRQFQVDKAAHYVPFTWLKHSEKRTNLGVAPYPICPRLQMVDLNKDKDGKFRRFKGVMPERTSAILDLSLETFDPETLDVYLYMEDVANISERIAADFWSSHIIHCTREASSSGLSQDEKKDIPKYRGECGFTTVRTMVYKDVLVLPITSRNVEFNHEVRWIPKPIPKSVPTVSASVEDNHPEEGPDLNKEPSSKPTSEAVETSQPMALAMVHPPATSVEDTAESSRQLSLPPSLETMIEKIVEEKVGKIVEERTEHLAQQLEVRVQKQVEESLAPTNAMVNKMLELLMDFQKTQGQPQPPPPPPPPPPV